jgi:2-iminobutanoate/2-iminopropanoate deaminase
VDLSPIGLPAMSFETPVPEGGSPSGGNPYSAVVISGDFVFLSGQVPRDPSSPTYPGVVSEDFEEQVTRVFENMRRCLAAAGCGFEDVVKVTGFIADFADFPAFNNAYLRYFSEPYPARTTVGVHLRGFKIEVECIARVPSRV